MHEKVTPFPIPPSQRFWFRMGGRTQVLIIPAPARRKPKRAQVIPISTTVSIEHKATGADATFSLHSAPTGVMNVLNAGTPAKGARTEMSTKIAETQENKQVAGPGGESKTPKKANAGTEAPCRARQG